MQASLIFGEEQVCFRLHVKTAPSNPDAVAEEISEAPAEAATEPEPASLEPLCFLYADDQGGARLQALKMAVSLGVEVEKPKWDKEEMRGELSASCCPLQTIQC